MSLEAKPPATQREILRELWGYARGSWTLLTLSAVLAVCTALLEVAPPLLFAFAVDHIIAMGRPEELLIFAALYVSVVAGRSLLTFAQLLALQIAGCDSMNRLRIAAYSHSITRRANFYDRMPAGELLARLTGDVAAVNEIFASGAASIVGDLIRVVIIAGTMFYVHVKLATLSLALLPLLALLFAVMQRRTRAAFSRLQEAGAELGAVAQEHLSCIEVVKSMRMQDAVVERLSNVNLRLNDDSGVAIVSSESLTGIFGVCTHLSMALVVWYGTELVATGETTTGMLIAFIYYIDRFFLPLRIMTYRIAPLSGGLSAMERMLGLLRTGDVDAPKRSEAARKPDSSAIVVFDAVGFGYTEERTVISDFSLEVERGSRLAIVGATGSGKSTTIKLLSRLYEVSEGAIFLDGDDIRSLDRETLRSRVAIVNQSAYMFAGTVLENVALGAKRQPSRDEVRHALDRIGASGMDLDADARALSVGEKQLVAFARALLRDCEVMVLDEATASVDSESESRIEHALEELMLGKTTIVIAHRLSTVKAADVVVVMEDGRIVEQGSYEELAEADGAFRRLLESHLRTEGT